MRHTGFLQVDGLSTDLRDLGRHKRDPLLTLIPISTPHFIWTSHMKNVLLTSLINN